MRNHLPRLPRDSGNFCIGATRFEKHYHGALAQPVEHKFPFAESGECGTVHFSLPSRLEA